MIEIFSNIQSCSNLKNTNAAVSMSPKISIFGPVLDKLRRNIFSFADKFKFPTEFELKIREATLN
jgi:hypothetical protein